MRWFEAPARTAAPKGHHLHLLRSTAFNPRITYTRIRPPALVAHLFSRTRSPPAAWRSRPTRRRLRGPGPRRSSSCAWSTPDPHGLRNQVVGGGHGRDRALLLQDLANDLLLELIGVFGSGHEFILSCHGKKLFPSPEDSAHSIWASSYRIVLGFVGGWLCRGGGVVAMVTVFGSGARPPRPTYRPGPSESASMARSYIACARP